MTAALACLAGMGVLLIVSSVLWPSQAGTARRGPRAAGAAAAAALRGRLDRAGLARVPVAAFVAGSILLAVIAAAALQALFGVPALALAAGVAVAVLPQTVLTSRARARRAAGRSQWPDTVDQIVAGVRSGLGLPDALASLARTGPQAIRAEFARFEREQAAGGSFARGVDALKERLADPTADRILETVRMAREVGGSDVTAVLRDLAVALRADAAVRSELAARQSWVTNAARLGVAAPWIVLLLLAARPEAAQAYNSPAGAAVVLSGLAVSVIAYRLMRAIGRLPEEKRWFG